MQRTALRAAADAERYPAMTSPAFQDWWKQFKVTGDICPVRLGMSRDEVRAVLGDPEDTGGTSRKHSTPAIWKYDELEFHFGPGPDDHLELIYLERDAVVQISIGLCASAG